MALFLAFRPTLHLETVEFFFLHMWGFPKPSQWSGVLASALRIGSGQACDGTIKVVCTTDFRVRRNFGRTTKSDVQLAPRSKLLANNDNTSIIQ